MHEIDDESPLSDVDFDDAQDIIFFAVTLQGHDATYGQSTYARHTYMPDEIQTSRRFVDVISETDDGRLLIDFHNFHDTEPHDSSE